MLVNFSLNLCCFCSVCFWSCAIINLHLDQSHHSIHQSLLPSTVITERQYPQGQSLQHPLLSSTAESLFSTSLTRLFLFLLPEIIYRSMIDYSVAFICLQIKINVLKISNTLFCCSSVITENDQT